MPPKTTVHLETVAPHLAPGGVWVRICTDDEELLTEYALKGEAPNLTRTDVANLHASLATDAALAIEALERGVCVRVYFYDGDTGVCLRTIISPPK